MDSTTIRQHLRELNERMSEIKAEEEVVRNLIVGYEGWLRLNGTKGERSAEAPAPVRPRKNRASSATPSRAPSVTKGKVSMNSAILQVVEQGHGQPLRTSEILERAKALGARTDAKKPERVVDLMLYSHRDRGRKPVERVATQTWRWKGE